MPTTKLRLSLAFKWLASGVVLAGATCVMRAGAQPAAPAIGATSNTSSSTSEEPAVTYHPPWLRVRVTGGAAFPTAGSSDVVLRLSQEFDFESAEIAPIVLGLATTEELAAFYVQRIHLRFGLRGELGDTYFWANHAHFDALMVMHAGIAFGRIGLAWDLAEPDVGGELALRMRTPDAEASLALGFATIQGFSYPYVSFGLGWTFGAYRD